MLSFRSICRDETKSGVCPKLSRNQVVEKNHKPQFARLIFLSFKYASCEDDCASDGDCPGETEKCCYNGCGRSCLAVVEDPGTEAMGGPYAGDGIRVEGVNPNAPQIKVHTWDTL